VLAYAEVHYRPRFLPSLLSMRRPEIVCDAPTRVEKGRSVPLFLFVRHADRYPVTLHEVALHAVYDHGRECIARFPFGGCKIADPIWWDAINFMPESTGVLKLHPHVVVGLNGKTEQVLVDNYRGTGKSPLIVHVADEPYPGAEGWHHGDLHCHSFHTADQVEFGAPMEAMALAAFSMGLHWLAVTDHSYDLDDAPGDCAAGDPDLPKWKLMRNTAAVLQSSFTVIPGEEVTCRTKRGKNCHMLAIDSARFISGSGDGGERGLDTATEHSIGEAAAACLEWGGFACAAHPMERVPLLERLILNRGEWDPDDLGTPGISGLQIYNGRRDSGFRRGRSAWKKLLLDGHRMSIFGGSDSHGDFNRRRGIELPLVSVGEALSNTLGCVRTVVRAGSWRKDDICAALRSGRSVVTDGPFVDLSLRAGEVVCRPGDTMTGGSFSIHARFLSSEEFGALKRGTVYGGITGEAEERTIAYLGTFMQPYEHVFESSTEERRFSYIRAECETASGRLCLSNPVWLDLG